MEGGPAETAQRVVIAQLGAPFGIRGELHVQSFTEPACNLSQYRNWFVSLKGQWQRLEPRRIRPHGRGFVAEFAGLDSPEAAERYNRALVSVNKSDLPALDAGEYYWSELIGLQVVNQDKLVLGQVSSLFETGSNDVLVVKGEKEHLIPYLPGDYVKQIDLKERTLHVEWDPDF